MSNHFLSKLVQGHRILSAQMPELLTTLQGNPLLTPNCMPTGNVFMYRELCAALLWLDAGTFSLPAVKQLPPIAQVTLCELLGLTPMPVFQEDLSDQIFRHIETKRSSTAAQGARAGAHPTAGDSGGGGRGVAAASAPGGDVSAPTSGGGETQTTPIGRGSANSNIGSAVSQPGAGQQVSRGAEGGAGSLVPQPLAG